MSEVESIDELMNKAHELPDGPLKIGLLEKAIAIADQMNLVNKSFEIRLLLIHVAMFTHRPDLILVHFSWCLARHDENPKEFDSWKLLWKYKWVMTNVGKFSEISREKIESLFGDMERRFLEYGSGQRAVWSLRMSQALNCGKWDEAEQAYKLMIETNRDDLSNCIACESDELVRYFLLLKKWKEALAAALPILSGKQSCLTVPERTYNRLIVPLIQMEKQNEAEEIYNKGMALRRTAARSTCTVDGHVIYLTIVNRIADAMKLFNCTNLQGLYLVGQTDRFYYLRATLFLMERHAIGKSRSRPKLPSQHELAKTPPKELVPEFTKQLRAECQLLAKKLDERNGTSAFADRLDEIKGWHELADQYQEAA